MPSQGCEAALGLSEPRPVDERLKERPQHMGLNRTSQKLETAEKGDASFWEASYKLADRDATYNVALLQKRTS